MTRESHVVAVLPRGEAIRNFVYSGVLDKIAQQSRMTLLSVFPSPAITKLLFERYDGVRELKEIDERWIVRWTREILDMSHGRWLGSAAATERWRLRDTEAGTMRLRVKRAANKLACYPFASRQGLELLSRVERQASHRLRTTDEYLDLFRTIEPTLVFNGSHVHSRVAVPAVQAAQWLGIPTATFIFSWDNLTSQGRVLPPYDYYLVWNAELREQLLDIYGSVSPDQIFVTGTPQFDFHFQRAQHWTREDFCARVGADPLRPIVVYTTGMANHFPGEPEIVDSISRMLKAMPEFGPAQLLVRIYPKDRTNRFDELKRSRPDILFPEALWEPTWLTPTMEDAALLTNTLRHAALGINVVSTVSLELCMFGKPVINIGYNPPGTNVRVDYRRFYDFDHYRPVVDSGAVMLAESEEQMPGMLRKALSRPDAWKSPQQALMSRMFGDTLDGCSGARVAERLLVLAGAPAPAGRPIPRS